VIVRADAGERRERGLELRARARRGTPSSIREAAAFAFITATAALSAPSLSVRAAIA
jgi:hypothetical protein